jgi:hypothetical protein
LMQITKIKVPKFGTFANFQNEFYDQFTPHDTELKIIPNKVSMLCFATYDEAGESLSP